jgi:hypothetical protein
MPRAPLTTTSSTDIATAQPPSAPASTVSLRNQVLSWVGIIGMAVTVFSNLSSLLQLADWGRQLVIHWEEWTKILWVWSFSWIGIHIPAPFAPALTFLLFSSTLTIRARAFSGTYPPVSNSVSRPLQKVFSGWAIYIACSIPLFFFKI